jgi:ElaB/YqjD/DUF883 family membrane-anchored ribosome-binding protein
MNDILMENVRDLHSRVTETGKAIDERVQSATAATAIAAGQAQKMVQDGTEAAAAGVEQAKKVLGDAAQHAWSQAGGVAEDVVDAGRHATRSVSRQIHESPLIAVLVGIAFACLAGLWFRGGGPNAKAASHRRSRVATPQKKGVSQ